MVCPTLYRVGNGELLVKRERGTQGFGMVTGG
jgi:hypothetical protein